MAWSLSYRDIRKPEFVDALLLAMGKSLYLANAFEVKCKSIVGSVNFVLAAEADPVLSLEQIVAKLPKGKPLAGTLQDIVRIVIRDEESMQILDKARIARNFIAHEGAAVGPVWDLLLQDIAERASLLRAAVGDLVAGDNLVSAWCYEMDEGRRAPQDFKELYPALVNGWVFGELDEMLAMVDPAKDRRETLLELLNRRQGERD